MIGAGHAISEPNYNGQRVNMDVIVTDLTGERRSSTVE